jgi:hypothetical protein
MHEPIASVDALERLGLERAMNARLDVTAHRLALGWGWDFGAS